MVRGSAASLFAELPGLPLYEPQDPGHKYAISFDDHQRMALIQDVLSIRHSALERNTRSTQSSLIRCYITFCFHFGVEAFPVSVWGLSLYMVQYVKCFGNRASNLPGILSALKRYSLERGHPWLSDLDLYFITDLRRGLGKLDRRAPRRKRPITARILAAMRGYVGPAASLYDFQGLVMAHLAHDALLRGIELVSLYVSDVQWGPDRQTAMLRIRRSKMNKLGEDELVTLPCYAGPYSGLAYLRSYWYCLDLDALANQDVPLFPLLAPAAIPSQVVFASTSLPHRKAQFVSWCRRLLEALGFSPEDYSGHSFRSGGATDLWEGGAPPLVIQLHGRWKSDVVYLYIRDNPENRAHALAAAFGNVASLFAALPPPAPLFSVCV